ncbi:MAG TPA: hypothetical protein VFF13_05715 [archaeon]|nr:hypothetical protein [archaeon]
MPKADAKKLEEFQQISDKIASFAKKYNRTIEDSVLLPDEKNQPVKLLKRVLYYPSTFMLSHNAIKRVKTLSTNFCLAALSSDYGIQSDLIEQNLQLGTVFSEKNSTEEITKLIFTSTASSLIIPTAGYLIDLFGAIQIGAEFLIGGFFFSFVMVMVFNYFQYTTIRKDLKQKFNSIKEEIEKLE